MKIVNKLQWAEKKFTAPQILSSIAGHVFKKKKRNVLSELCVQVKDPRKSQLICIVPLQ